jgi:hypothetical protein
LFWGFVPGVFDIQRACTFWLGMACVLTGFLFISLEELSWRAAERLRVVALTLALVLYLVRLVVFEL